MPLFNFNPNPEKATSVNPFLRKIPFFNFQADGQNPPLNPFLNLQTRLSSFLQHLSQSPLQTRFETTLQNINAQSKQAISHLVPPLSLRPSAAPSKSPLWARINAERPSPSGPHSMSSDAIEGRLAGIAVYALCKGDKELVLLAGMKSRKSLGFFCFKKDDAEALLVQMKGMEPSMRQGSKVVPVPLNKAFQLKLNGAAFRFIPDSDQIKNALKVKKAIGESAEGFSGVPVFQCQGLLLSMGKKRYQPVFFKMEDLEESLSLASQHQRILNPALRPGNIQVCVLEEIINGMKDGSTSAWKDVVFIPPGFELKIAGNESNESLLQRVGS